MFLDLYLWCVPFFIHVHCFFAMILWIIVKCFRYVLMYVLQHHKNKTYYDYYYYILKLFVNAKIFLTGCSLSLTTIWLRKPRGHQSKPGQSGRQVANPLVWWRSTAWPPQAEFRVIHSSPFRLGIAPAVQYIHEWRLQLFLTNSFVYLALTSL